MRRKIIVLGILIIILSFALIFFSQEEDIEKYEETNLDLEVIVSVKNLGQSPAFDIPVRLALPEDHPPHQYVKRISFSQPPQRVTEDSLSNKFFHYRIERLEPQATKNFTFNLSLKLISLDFHIQKSKVKGGYDDNMTPYLLESSYINVNDPEIIAVAHKIANKSDNLVEIAWNSYEWIIQNIYYQQVPGEGDARTTLKNREGGSAELSNLFVALLRANHIPARRISGWAHHFKKEENLSLTRFSHGWTEFYLPSYGWIPVDPTWGKSHKFDWFAKTQDSHIVVTKGADIHYFWRGPYGVPYGETKIDTDYRIRVKDKKVKNLSFKREVITLLVFFLPLLFVIFIVYKRIAQRRV